MRNLRQDDFDTLWPRAPAELVRGILATQAAVWPAAGINTILRLAHLMAQASHESDTGTEIVESLNYSEAALLDQWPTHFTPAQARQYGRNSQHPADQRMIGILAYGGRMGNAPRPSDDGYKFRGRGLLQTTGKESYHRIGQLCGLDLMQHPELAADPLHALVVAATEFTESGCLPYCDQDNLLAVSSLVNVGHVVHDSRKVIGWDQRKAWLESWKRHFHIV